MLRRYDLQTDGPLPVHPLQLARSHRTGNRRQAADRLHARQRRADWHGRQRFRRRPLTRLENHVHAIIAIEIFADKKATGHRPHGAGEAALAEPGLGNLTFVGVDLKLRLRNRQSRHGTSHCAGKEFVDCQHADPGASHQCADIRPLQIHVDRAPATEAKTEQRGTGWERLCIRQTNQQLISEQGEKIVDFFRLFRIQVEHTVRAVHRQVVSVDIGLLLVIHVWLQAPHDLAGNFFFQHFHGAAGRQTEKGLHRIGLCRWQEIRFRHQQRGDRNRRDQQPADPGAALKPGIGQSHHQTGDAIPPMGHRILYFFLAQPARTGCRQDGHGHGPRSEHRDRQGQGQIGKQLAFHALHEQDRQKNRDTGQRRGK